MTDEKTLGSQEAGQGRTSGPLSPPTSPNTSALSGCDFGDAHASSVGSHAALTRARRCSQGLHSAATPGKPIAFASVENSACSGPKRARLGRTAVDAALAAHRRSSGQATLANARQSAVLVPLVDRPDGVAVRFIVRPAHMKHHPDQPAFPGGTVDPEDGGDYWVTALRETHEELALPASAITKVATLAPLPTGTGFVINPFVGWVDPSAPMVPSPAEVASVFDAPLEMLMDPQRLRTIRGQFRGVDYPIRFYLGHPRVIWGATAHILAGLLSAIERG